MPAEARPIDSEWPAWSGYLREAWEHLRNDRHWGAMGGAAGIYYSAISNYAHDHVLMGEEFAFFLKMIRALDDEYLSVMAKSDKEEREKIESRNKH